MKYVIRFASACALVAALLTPRPPTLMVLNEPETSLPLAPAKLTAAAGAWRPSSEQLQATTGCLVVLHNRQPMLVPRGNRTTPLDPNNGGHAA